MKLYQPTLLSLAVLALTATSVVGQKPAPTDRNVIVEQAARQAVAQQRRVALVIGNAAYKEAPLLNPVNDARAIAAALKDSGFTVILRENADQRSMASAMREFGDKLGGGGTGLFYYAGHGMQIKGRNFLIPVGANVDREDEVAYSAIDAQAVLDKMEAAGNGMNIMILDACRNNPFTRSTRSGQAGLAQMDAPVGTLVAFATSPGNVASDGAGANGLYTQHLLQAMRTDGAKVEDVFKQVRANVRKDSQGKQIPWEATSLEGDFYFKGGKTVVNVAAVQSASPVAAPAPANVAVASSRPAPQLPANDSSLQSAVERRTQELLLQLEKSPSSVKPTLQINSVGYTVGDRWRYQMVDKFKGEVVNNYALQIDGILPNGDLSLNKGSTIWDARGQLKYSKASDRERIVRNFVQYPDKLEVGHKQNDEYVTENKFTGGLRQYSENSKQAMIVRGQEAVKTPAGEFMAWKIEREVWWQNTEGGAGIFKTTGWYVPALRRYVAWDQESRNSNGSFNYRERHELTSYSVRGAEEALAKR